DGPMASVVVVVVCALAGLAKPTRAASTAITISIAAADLVGVGLGTSAPPFMKRIGRTPRGPRLRRGPLSWVALGQLDLHHGRVAVEEGTHGHAGHRCRRAEGALGVTGGDARICHPRDVGAELVVGRNIAERSRAARRRR